MEPTTENAADIWSRFRTGQKSLEQLAEEQGTKIPASIDGYFDDIMPEDETPEMLNAAVERWREETRNRTNP